MDAAAALRCLSAARTLARSEAGAWPGWDFDAVPVALGVPEGTVLWGHPSPPEEFAPLEGPDDGAPPGPAFLGPPVEGMANSTIALGDAEVATARLEGMSPGFDAASLILHEAFHAFQHRIRPGSGVPGHLTPDYPEEDAANNALARAENLSLAAFLEGGRDPATCARDVLALRRVRYACVPESWPAYEAAAEWCEGGATLAETLAGGGRGVPVLAADLRRHNVGGAGAAYRRFYATGAAIGLLLGALSPDWRSRWLEPGATPEGLLRKAVGAPPDLGEAGPGREDGWDAAAEAALRRWDVAGLLAAESAATARRRRETEALLASLAPALVIDCSAAPATGFGFDPTRRRVLSGGRQLHGGWTRLEGRGWAFEVPEGPVLEERAARRLVLRAPAEGLRAQGLGPLHVPFLRAARAAVERDGSGWRIVVTPGGGAA